ncbi:MAG: bifunctional phosphoglucose/phosphomannose isomerase [Anaerolineales bacterium]
MILDQPQRFAQLDPQDMLGEIDRLPAQLQAAWELSQALPLPSLKTLRQVVIAGMGGSAIGADLLAAYAAPIATVPILIWRNYDLPRFVGPDTLLIASSHSGNTEETLAAFEKALQVGANVLVVTTGGSLAKRAEAASVPVWRFEHTGQPRAAVGYSFGLLLGALVRLGVVEFDPTELSSTIQAMQEQAASIRADVPVAKNLAKRMAGQLMDRWPTILGADLMAPVARRWRTQIAEIAKAMAQFEELPEADHNMVAGVEHPKGMIGPTMVVFLRSSFNHPRNLTRLEATRHVLMLEGFNTDIIECPGPSRLAQQWTGLHMGDYLAYYLAMAYGVDPTPVMAIEDLKARLSAS